MFSEGNVHFLFIFMGIDRKMAGTERKNHITQKEGKKDTNEIVEGRNNEREKQRKK